MILITIHSIIHFPEVKCLFMPTLFKKKKKWCSLKVMAIIGKPSCFIKAEEFR